MSISAPIAKEVIQPKAGHDNSILSRMIDAIGEGRIGEGSRKKDD